MSSCNAEPVKLEISPIITGDCAIKRSCNACVWECALIWLLFSLFSNGCTIKRSCNVVEFFVRFQYSGVSSLHFWTRSTLSGLQK